MIDPELKTELDQINQNLVQLKNKTSGGVGHAFLVGMFNALGYLVGLAIAVVILILVLQKTGYWDSFKQEMQTFSDVLNSAKKLTAPGQTSGQPSSSDGSTLITLPNGQQYRVNTAQ